MSAALAIEDRQRVHRYESDQARMAHITKHCWVTSEDLAALQGLAPGLTSAEAQRRILDGQKRRTDWDTHWRQLALDWYASTLDAGVDLEDKSAELVTHERYPWAVSALDGLTLDGSTRVGVVVALGWEWTGLDEEGLAELALHRCAWDMAITGLRGIDVVHLVGRPGRAPGLQVTPVRRTGRAPGIHDEQLLHAVKAWRGEWVFASKRPAEWPEPPPAGFRRASSEEEGLITHIDGMQRKIARLQRERQAMIDELAEKMGTARGVIGRRRKALWHTDQLEVAQAVDLEQLQEDWPEVWEKVRPKRRGKKQRTRTLKTFVTGGPS